MSVHVSAWAWDQPVSGNAKLVLLALADECRGSDGLCWPGLKRVAAMTCIEVRSVRRHIEALEKAGLLVREERQREDGSRTSNLLRLAVPHPDATVRGGSDTPVRTRAVEKEPKEATPPPPESPEFKAWLAHHEEVTGEITLRPGTAAYKEVVSMHAARVAEGYPAEDLLLAIHGAWNDDFRREKGNYGPKSVLRPKMVADLIAKGRRARKQSEAASPYDALEDR